MRPLSRLTSGRVMDSSSMSSQPILTLGTNTNWALFGRPMCRQRIWVVYDEKCPSAASGLRVLRLNVQEVRLGSNPCPSLHLGIFERQLCVSNDLISRRKEKLLRILH